MSDLLREALTQLQAEEARSPDQRRPGRMGLAEFNATDEGLAALAESLQSITAVARLAAERAPGVRYRFLFALYAAPIQEGNPLTGCGTWP